MCVLLFTYICIYRNLVWKNQMINQMYIHSRYAHHNLIILGIIFKVLMTGKEKKKRKIEEKGRQ